LTVFFEGVVEMYIRLAPIWRALARASSNAAFLFPDPGKRSDMQKLEQVVLRLADKLVLRIARPINFRHQIPVKPPTPIETFTQDRRVFLRFSRSSAAYHNAQA
jgi:hypothetical protein